MLDSVLVQMKGAYDSFWASKRIEWISKSCGQIIQTVSRTTWTKEVVMNTTNIHHHYRLLRNLYTNISRKMSNDVSKFADGRCYHL